jgi:predicted acyltransferase
VIIGYFAGVFIKKTGNNFETIAKLILAGAAMVCVAYFWDLHFPINKKFRTGSFVLYTCGIDLVILGTLIYIIDILGRKNWTYFFEVFGKNPLFIYLLSEIIAILLWFIPVNGKSLYEVINDAVYQELIPGPWGSLAFALTVMMTCWSVGYVLDKKKIYVRV